MVREINHDHIHNLIPKSRVGKMYEFFVLIEKVKTVFDFFYLFDLKQGFKQFLYLSKIRDFNNFKSNFLNSIFFIQIGSTVICKKKQ